MAGLRHSSQRPYKTIRVVCEMRVPEDVTEKSLVWRMKELLPWPIKLMRRGGKTFRGGLTFKSYSRVRQSEKIKESRA